MSVILPTIDIVDRPQSHGYDGSIDNLLIRLAVSPETPLEDATAEATAPRIDTSESAEDVRDEVGRRYSRSDLSGGAGLDFLHAPNRPDDAAIRFWDSRGVDVFNTDKGNVYEASLMHEVEAQSIGSDLIDVCQIDGTVYFARAAGIYEFGVGPIKVAHTGILKMVAMGNSLYTLDATNGVRRYDPPSWTPVSISAVATYDEIWAVKSRIVAVEDNVLSDATDDSVLLTLPPADTVTDVIDSGPAVLVFATTGNVHALTPDQNSVLVPAGMSKFINEIPVYATEAFGILGIVTAEATEAGGRVARFYTAELTLSGAYDLSDLQLIYEIGDRTTTDDLTPHAMLATRDSIYSAIPEEGSNEITLWRYYLPTGGYARAHSVTPASQKSVASMVEVDDRMYVCLASDDLYQEIDDYVTTGWFIGPLADFYTADNKQWVGAELSGSELPIGAGLELYTTVDPDLINDEPSTDWQLVTKLLAGESEKEVNTLSLESRYDVAKIIMRSDGTRAFTPGFRSYSFRALPNPVRDILLRVPINVSDQVESPGRRPIIVKGRGTATEDALRAYEGAHVLIELYRPALQVQGLIERFESTIQVISPLGSVRRVLYARIRGSRLLNYQGVGGATSGSSLGQDTLGLVTLGKGVATT